MKNQPLVSVIVPVFNTEEVVERTLNSICTQTYKNFELIIINDGSTDASEEVCKLFVEKDSRVRYFYKENGGVSSARNLGLAKARGEYILFCDSDDKWEMTLLEVVVNQMTEGNYDMVRFSYKSDNEDFLPSYQLPEQTMNEKELLLACFTDSCISVNMSICWGGIYKRNIIEQNNIRFVDALRIGEDSMFVLDYTMHCKRIKCIKEALYRYYPIFEKRVNATNREKAALYDQHELYGLLFQKFYSKYNNVLTNEEKEKSYSIFYHKVIGRMVCFVAYSTAKSRKEDKRRVSEYINGLHIIEAGKYFKRVRKTDSRLVPFFMKHRMSGLLWWALSLRAKKYLKDFGKKPYANTIWREGEARKYV